VLFNPDENAASDDDHSVSPRSLQDAEARLDELAWWIRIAPDPGVGESAKSN
jgi:hypothetical protein